MVGVAHKVAHRVAHGPGPRFCPHPIKQSFSGLYTHPDDHNLPTYDMTPGFKPFTNKVLLITGSEGAIRQIEAHSFVSSVISLFFPLGQD